MSEEDKPCQARPESDVRAEIMDSNIPKNDGGWWAHHKIKELEAEVERLELANENLQIDLALAKGDCTEIDWRSETDTALHQPKEGSSDEWPII